MDFGEESELEDLIEEIREQSNESYYPFPSKIFALLYLLVNSHHPIYGNASCHSHILSLSQCGSAPVYFFLSVIAFP